MTKGDGKGYNRAIHKTFWHSIKVVRLVSGALLVFRVLGNTIHKVSGYKIQHKGLIMSKSCRLIIISYLYITWRQNVGLFFPLWWKATKGDKSSAQFIFLLFFTSVAFAEVKCWIPGRHLKSIWFRARKYLY